MIKVYDPNSYRVLKALIDAAKEASRTLDKPKWLEDAITDAQWMIGG